MLPPASSCLHALAYMLFPTPTSILLLLYFHTLCLSECSFVTPFLQYSLCLTHLILTSVPLKHFMLTFESAFLLSPILSTFAIIYEFGNGTRV
jgi:hypothetical protein